jgi:hypothetical protein
LSGDQLVPAAETTAPAGGRNKSIFVSYARADLEKVHQVVEGLRLLGRDVWLDESLIGGQAWWDAILTRIRECAVFVQAISPAAARSEACTSERLYAASLGKPILPVFLEALPTSVLPTDLAVLQYVDYTEDAPERRAFRLAAALEGLPAAPALPDPLPPPPAIPISYLVALAEKVRAPELSLDEQSAIVARLRGAVEHPDERDGAIALLRQMQARNDLYHSVATEIDRSLAEISGMQATPQPTAQPAPRVEAPVEPPRLTQPAPAEPEPADDKVKVEVELNKWNWGAFLISPIWGIGNNVYRALLTLVPIYGIYEWIMCGKNGNRWAWENKEWDNIESFRKTQRKWATWGAIVDAILVLVFASSGGGSS